MTVNPKPMQSQVF